jgi:alkanesulfonate monooxygenase SsuD/methylene tetrahydromethanopterin reductase-like flavin-dependent oxidoreductase (luciferase family)
MQVGIFLATQWPEGADVDTAVADLAAQVRTAKDSGFTSVWFGQHYLTGPLQMLQTGPLIARLAVEGEGLTFGSAIYLVPMQSPVTLAEEVASLDWITGGRMVLGAGMGYRAEEFEAMGVPFGERIGRFTESLELIRRLWREPKVEHRGRYFTVPGLGASIRPKQAGGPPVWIGAEVPASVRRAARLGDAWFAPPTTTFDTTAELLAQYRQARAAEGLPVPATQPLIRECAIGPTRQAALAVARGPLLYKYESYASWGQLDSAGPGGLREVFDDFMAARFIVGDEAEVADALARHRDALGVDHMILRLQWPGLPQAEVLDAIRRIGRVAAKLG